MNINFVFDYIKNYKLSDIRFFLFFALFFMVTYFILYFPEITRETYPYGDLATDILLRNTIDNGVLLTGHYSRFGFHHPGSFFFYIDYVFDYCLSFFGILQYSSFLFASIVVNSIFLSIIILLILNIFEVEKKIFYGIFLSILLICLFYQFLPLDEEYHNPSKIVLPYMVFVLSMSFIINREYKYLPLSFLSMGIVIHGYVVMPLMTIPILAFAFIFSLLLNPKKITKDEFFYIRVGLLIGVLFALPMIIDVLVNLSNFENSNAYKIVHIANGPSDISTWKEVFVFFHLYFKNMGNIFFLLLLLIGFFMFHLQKVSVRRKFYYFIEVSLLISVIFLFYYRGVPKPYYEFIGMYYYGVVFSIYCILIFVVVITNSDKIKFLKDIKLVAFIFLVISLLSFEYEASRVPQNIQIKNFAEEIKANSSKEDLIIIDYENTIFLWAQAMGIILELSNQNYNVCTNINSPSLSSSGKICNNNSTFKFLSNVCKLDNITHINVINREDCNGSCLKEEFVFGIKYLNGIVPNKTIKHNSNDVCYKGWSYPEEKYRWSDGQVANIKFKLNSNNLDGILDLNISSLGKQKLTLVINGEYISCRYINSIDDIVESFKFNPKILKTSRLNNITFYLPNATKFGKDPRDLGIALRGFKIK